MALSINTNATSDFAVRSFNQISSDLERTTKRLSTGTRITKAADDAAGLSIASGIDTVVKSTDNARRNIMQGVGLIDTLDAGLKTVKENLQEIRDLTVKAYNSPNSERELAAIQREVVARVETINAIAENTQFGDKNIFDGTEDINILFGVNDEDYLSLDLASGTTGKGMEIAINNTNLGSLGEGSTINLQEFNVGSNSVSSHDGSATGRNGSLADINAMLDNINRMESKNSSYSNRLRTQSEFQEVFALGAQQLRSTMLDDDKAASSSEYFMDQVRQNMASSVLTQANSLSSVALNILP
ncbi:MAG: hypothetical protein MK033_00150 [Candidatus Caenarcaniphilales bacterium]|nr:hypothetical protein [Candidatus Caenarcaniphilales bacterium]